MATRKRPKGPRKQPRILSRVLEAFIDLGNKRGFTKKQIAEHVETLVIAHSRRKTRPGNITREVKRAIKHGLETGIIQVSGKRFKLAINLNKWRPSLRVPKPKNLALKKTAVKKRTEKRQKRIPRCERHERQMGGKSGKVEDYEDMDEMEDDDGNRTDIMPDCRYEDQLSSNCGYDVDLEQRCDNPNCLCNLKQTPMNVHE